MVYEDRHSCALCSEVNSDSFGWTCFQPVSSLWNQTWLKDVCFDAFHALAEFSVCHWQNPHLDFNAKHLKSIISNQSASAKHDHHHVYALGHSCFEL